MKHSSHNSAEYCVLTAALAVLQVRKIVDAAYKRTLALLEEKKDLVTALAEELLEKEVCTCQTLITPRVKPNSDELPLPSLERPQLSVD